MVEETAEKIEENYNKVNKNAGKVIPRLLKFFGKIETVGQYDDYLKEVTLGLVDWFVSIFIIRAFLIFICLTAFGIRILINNHPPTIVQISLAEGISLLWYLITEFKKDLWRK